MVKNNFGKGLLLAALILSLNSFAYAGWNLGLGLLSSRIAASTSGSGAASQFSFDNAPVLDVGYTAPFSQVFSGGFGLNYVFPAGTAGSTSTVQFVSPYGQLVLMLPQVLGLSPNFQWKSGLSFAIINPNSLTIDPRGFTQLALGVPISSSLIFNLGAQLQSFHWTVFGNPFVNDFRALFTGLTLSL